MNKRIDWVDAGKGCAMLLVIMGYCALTPRSCVIALYIFHMPLFLFLSGYVLNASKYAHFIDLLKAKLKGIVWPYFMLSLCLFVWSMIINHKSNFINEMLGEKFLGIFVAMRDTPLYLSMWYLNVLFLCSLLLYVLIKLAKGKTWLLTLFLVVSACIGFVISKSPYKVWVWNSDLVFTCVAFMGLGYIVRVNEDKLKLIRKAYFLPVALIGYVVAGYLNHQNIYYTDLF